MSTLSVISLSDKSKVRRRVLCGCMDNYISGKITKKLFVSGRVTESQGWKAACIFTVDLFFHLQYFKIMLFTAAPDILVHTRWHAYYVFK